MQVGGRREQLCRRREEANSWAGRGGKQSTLQGRRRKAIHTAGTTVEGGSANSPQATAVPDEGRHQKAKRGKGFKRTCH